MLFIYYLYIIIYILYFSIFCFLKKKVKKQSESFVRHYKIIKEWIRMKSKNE